MLTSNEVNTVVSVIYRIEGGTNTIWPYGIKTKYKHTTPKQACENTVRHVCKDYNIVKVDRSFITILADKYCPPQDDPIGNRNWKANAIQILHL